LFSLEERPVPQIGRIPELTEAYHAAFRAYLKARGPLREEASHQFSEAKLTIERELARYAPIPEFLTFQYKGRYYAVLNNQVWSCIRSLTEEQWRALISQTLAREEAKLAACLTGRNEKQSKRECIPESVRVEVWRRDAAKCVRCGSRERLEFDHIIPVSLGGSSTARNVQLLCESCNRMKGASVA